MKYCWPSLNVLLTRPADSALAGQIVELHGERLNGVVGLPHQLVEQIVLCESHLQHPGFQSVDAFGLLCRAVPPQHFLNSRQAALSRVAKRRLTLGINRSDIGAGASEQLCHFAAIILLRGVHDQGRHPIEF